MSRLRIVGARWTSEGMVLLSNETNIMASIPTRDYLVPRRTAPILLSRWIVTRVIYTSETSLASKSPGLWPQHTAVRPSPFFQLTVIPAKKLWPQWIWSQPLLGNFLPRLDQVSGPLFYWTRDMYAQKRSLKTVSGKLIWNRVVATPIGIGPLPGMTPCCSCCRIYLQWRSTFRQGAQTKCRQRPEDSAVVPVQDAWGLLDWMPEEPNFLSLLGLGPVGPEVTCNPAKRPLQRDLSQDRIVGENRNQIHIKHH